MTSYGINSRSLESMSLCKSGVNMHHQFHLEHLHTAHYTIHWSLQPYSALHQSTIAPHYSHPARPPMLICLMVFSTNDSLHSLVSPETASSSSSLFSLARPSINSFTVYCCPPLENILMITSLV